MIFATFYAFSSSELHDRPRRAIFSITGPLDSAFYCCGNRGTHESSPCAWSQALSKWQSQDINPRSHTKAGTPWPHRLGSCLAGENKLGTKMEAIERKYARVDAKINYKTFTSKMRSLNSSKKESASRAERARHWNRKLDTWRAFLRKDFLPRALLSSTFFFFGRYLLERHTYPFSNTRIKSHAQSESSFFYFDLCLHVRMNPRNEGFRSFPRQDLHCMACLSGSLSLL